MKLASLKHGRDGTLVVVSRDLSRAVVAAEIAPTLQAALDAWRDTAPKLDALSIALNDGRCANTFAFDEGAVSSPLPRAYQWADGSAYVNHVELVRRARGAQMPKTFWTDPLMYQGGSDDFIGPHDDIVARDESWGIDLEGELAVVTDDVAMGTSRADAGSHIQLLMLVNDVSLRGLIPGELDKGFGFFQSKPASAFSPVAVTPDELGDAWDGGRVHLPLLAFVNDAPFGRPNAGVDMVFDFCDLIAHAEPHAQSVRRHHHRFRHRVESPGSGARHRHRGRRRRIYLHRGDPHDRDDSHRLAGNAVPALRRFGAPGDARCARRNRSSVRSRNAWRRRRAPERDPHRSVAGGATSRNAVRCESQTRAGRDAQRRCAGASIRSSIMRRSMR